MRTTLPPLLLTALLAACASTPPEQDPVQLKLNELETRVARVERIAANQADMSQRLDDVQQNQRELRGRIEEIEHGSEALGKQQRDLYADLDKRLGATGSGSSAAASGAVGGSAAAGAPGGAAAALPADNTGGVGP